MKKYVALMLEWLRPAGIMLIYFCSEFFGTDPVSKFHILGPGIVVLMSGTVALESLVLGETASQKIGYTPNRPYQIQSGLNNLATAVTGLLVFILDWGRYADATIVSVMLIFFAFSAANHAVTAIRDHNRTKVNIMRPLLCLLLIALLLPPMIRAIGQ